MGAVRAPGGGPPPPGSAARFVAAGPGGWLAIGPKSIWTSPDGRTWTLASTAGLPLRPGDQISVLQRTAAGFIAVGSNVPGGHQAEATPVIFLSADGLSWRRLGAGQLGLGQGAARLGRVLSIRYAAAYQNQILIAGDVAVPPRAGTARRTGHQRRLAEPGRRHHLDAGRPARRGPGRARRPGPDQRRGRHRVRIRPGPAGHRGPQAHRGRLPLSRWHPVDVCRRPDHPGRPAADPASAGLVSGGPDGAVVSGQAGQALVAFTSADGASWRQTPPLGAAAAQQVSGVAVAQGGTVVVAGTTTPARPAWPADAHRAAGRSGRAAGQRGHRGDPRRRRSAAGGQRRRGGERRAGPAGRGGRRQRLSRRLGLRGRRQYLDPGERPDPGGAGPPGDPAADRRDLRRRRLAGRGRRQPPTGAPPAAPGGAGLRQRQQLDRRRRRGGLQPARPGHRAGRRRSRAATSSSATRSPGRTVAAAWWSTGPDRLAPRGRRGLGHRGIRRPGRAGGRRQMRAVTAGPRGFIAVGADGDAPAAWASADGGRTWTQQNVPLPVGAGRAALTQVASNGARRGRGRLPRSPPQAGCSRSPRARPTAAPPGPRPLCRCPGPGVCHRADRRRRRVLGHRDVRPHARPPGRGGVDLANGSAWTAVTPGGQGLTGPGHPGHHRPDRVGRHADRRRLHRHPRRRGARVLAVADPLSASRCAGTANAAARTRLPCGCTGSARVPDGLDQAGSTSPTATPGPGPRSSRTTPSGSTRILRPIPVAARVGGSSGSGTWQAAATHTVFSIARARTRVTQCSSLNGPAAHAAGSRSSCGPGHGQRPGQLPEPHVVADLQPGPHPGQRNTAPARTPARPPRTHSARTRRTGAASGTRRPAPRPRRRPPPCCTPGRPGRARTPPPPARPRCPWPPRRDPSRTARPAVRPPPAGPTRT